MEQEFGLNIDSIRKHKTASIIMMSIPAIISMVMTSLINVADGFFMGNFIHKDAIAAVNLGLPIIYIYLGAGLMVGVGGSVIASIALGAKDIQKARAAFNQTVFMAAATALFLSVAFFFLLKPVANVLGAGGRVAEYFFEYYTILLFELPLMIMSSVLGTFLFREGKPNLAMNITVFGVLLNIVLDYVFAALLKTGIKGIAFASLIAAGLQCLWSVTYYLKFSRIFKFSRFAFDKEAAVKMLQNGSSECIGELSMCICMFCYNLVILKNFGPDGVTAFTIVGYTAYVFSMIITGFCMGCGPLISFSIGAKEKRLGISIRKRTSLMVFLAGAVVVIILCFVSGWYSRVFVQDEKVQQMALRGIRIFMFNFLLCGINSIASAYFTSCGKAKESAIISSSRGLVILLATIFILPMIFGFDGIFLTSPVTETITLLLTFIFIREDSKELEKDSGGLAA